MPDFLKTAFANGPQVSPFEVLVRLLIAFGYGLLIAAIYRFTRQEQIPRSTFPVTLMLLAVLIAMVTQVIGDNVARAFSLVGALSIVRFRTVVRDTQDTAYVILSVIVGMAIGARSLWVAGIGIAVVALAELVVMIVRRVSSFGPSEFVLKIQVSLEQDLEALVAAALAGQLISRELVSMGTLKRGGSIEACYRVVPREGVSIPELIRLLAGAHGVQSVQMARRGFDED